VTGVQTCALPIYGRAIGAPASVVGGGHGPRELDETDRLLAPETDAVESGQDNGSMS